MLAAPMARASDKTVAATHEPGKFAALLLRYRAIAGLSQEELAERAELSRRGISDLERGERRMPQASTGRRRAEALKLSDWERAALLASVHPTISSPVQHEQTAAVPPLPGGLPLKHNLPLSLTSFIGRERELEALSRMLPSTPLLTLTGPGGIGKTRLALEVSRTLIDH